MYCKTYDSSKIEVGSNFRCMSLDQCDNGASEPMFNKTNKNFNLRNHSNRSLSVSHNCDLTSVLTQQNIIQKSKSFDYSVCYPVYSSSF